MLPAHPKSTCPLPTSFITSEHGLVQIFRTPVSPSFLCLPRYDWTTYQSHLLRIIDTVGKKVLVSFYFLLFPRIFNIDVHSHFAINHGYGGDWDHFLLGCRGSSTPMLNHAPTTKFLKLLALTELLQLRAGYNHLSIWLPAPLNIFKMIGLHSSSFHSSLTNSYATQTLHFLLVFFPSLPTHLLTS
mmetsp:Transcript_11865/g.17181  ORF Transcript_11865/g.17181 Transcript_11865/m.17181 type:complete len:186 (-) Transcript_11865:329-886(-)